MSLYSQYINERLGQSIIEDDFGFATYDFIDQFNVKACYIMDIYVKPEFRRDGHAKRYVDEIEVIAKENNCECLLGSVFPKTKGAEESLIFQFNIGYKLLMNENDKIWTVKEI